jgi:hypothetical protein
MSEIKQQMTDEEINDMRIMYATGHELVERTIDDLLDARALIEKQTEAITLALAVLEANRAELEGYEAWATGETYNSPSLNDIIEKCKEYL